MKWKNSKRISFILMVGVLFILILQPGCRLEQRISVETTAATTRSLVAEPNGHICTGDFDGDGLADTATGRASANVGSITSAGDVLIDYGAPGRADQIIHQNTPGILCAAEAYDYFGCAVAAGDFDNDGYDDLAVGVRGENFSAVPIPVPLMSFMDQPRV